MPEKATSDKAAKKVNVYRLESGKIHRIGKDGNLVTFKAKCEVIPTVDEYKTNRRRLTKLYQVEEGSAEYRKLEVPSKAEAEPDVTPVDIDEAETEQELDALAEREALRPRPRNRIIRLISARRKEILTEPVLP